MVSHDGALPPDTYSFRVKNKAGEELWVELKTVLIDWEARPATLNFLSNITERRQAEEALQESLNNYQILFDNAADLIAVIDTRGNFLDINRKFEEESGYKREEMIGKNVFSSGIITEASSDEVFSHLEKLIAGKQWPIFNIDGV